MVFAGVEEILSVRGDIMSIDFGNHYTAVYKNIVVEKSTCLLVELNKLMIIFFLKFNLNRSYSIPNISI